MEQKVEQLIASAKNPKLKSLSISYSDGILDYVAATTHNNSKQVYFVASTNPQRLLETIDAILEEIKEQPEDIL